MQSTPASQQSIPFASSQSSHNMSVDPSFQIYSCKWAWCRATFPNGDALVHHVIHDHARRTIPLRRRDIAMVRRVEEGSGESLKMSYIFKESYTSNSAASSQQLRNPESSLPGVKEPGSSLPSPPNSSPALRTPPSHTSPLPENEQSPGSSSSSGSENEQEKYAFPPAQFNATKLSSKVGTPNPSKFQQHLPLPSTPTFASLNSPADSLASQTIPNSIPNSPSFSSLVARPNKRKLAFELPERSRLTPSRSHPLSQPQSSSSRSSTGSQMSVELQLTQSPESESDTDANKNRKGSVHDDVSQQQLNGDITLSQNPELLLNQDHQQGIYGAKLHWDPSQTQGPHKYFTSQSESQEITAGFDLLTQPPSQLQLGVFPFHHHHEPKVSANYDHRHGTGLEPSSSAPFQLSPPAPIAEPTFAMSTPQSWYQPPLRRKHSKTVEPATVNAEVVMTPSKSQSPSNNRRQSRTPRSKHTKPKSKFRSGTFQITPLPVLPSIIPEETAQHNAEELLAQDGLGMQDLYDYGDSQSEAYLDFSQASQDLNSPPLQTQAPYESQPMTQF